MLGAPGVTDGPLQGQTSSPFSVVTAANLLPGLGHTALVGAASYLLIGDESRYAFDAQLLALTVVYIRCAEDVDFAAGDEDALRLRSVFENHPRELAFIHDAMIVGALEAYFRQNQLPCFDGGHTPTMPIQGWTPGQEADLMAYYRMVGHQLGVTEEWLYGVRTSRELRARFWAQVRAWRKAHLLGDARGAELFWEAVLSDPLRGSLGGTSADSILAILIAGMATDEILVLKRAAADRGLLRRR